MERAWSLVNAVLFGKKDLGYERLPSIFEQVPFISNEERERQATHIASKVAFIATTVVMILANTVLLGLELDGNVGAKVEERLGYFIADLLFGAFFFGEMLLRQNQQGWDYFVDVWNYIDFMIIVLNCLDIAVATTTADTGTIRIATTLRILRLLRVTTQIKGLKAFQGMWMVIQGTVSSLRSLVWTGMFLVVVIYSFGVAFTTVVGQEASIKERWEDADVYVGSVFRSCITVLQVITLDSWASGITRNLIEKGGFMGALLLLMVLVVGSFGILNIIIALMVEKVRFLKKEQELKNGKAVKKAEEGLLAELGQDFAKADCDGSGQIDYEEFCRMLKDKSIKLKLRLLGITTEEAENFFTLMDADHSGTLTPEEFIEGLQRVQGIARSQDIAALISFAQRHALKAKRNTERTRTLIDQVDEIQRRLNTCGRTLAAEQSERKAAARANEQIWVRAERRTEVIKELDEDRRVLFPSLRPPVVWDESLFD